MVGALVAALIAQAAQQGPLPEVATRSRIDPSRGVDFHAIVVPDTVYIGQQATYQLGVFLDQETRQRIRRNPEFQPPETRALLSYDLRERRAGPLTGMIDGQPYEIHVFRRALFPLTPGRYEIPQARLTYALPQTASFFSREESYTLRSEAVAFVAIEPPMAGRPAGWAGAVGQWRASAAMDTARGREGEPFVLTLRIEGQGNVTLLPRPPVSIPWASVVSADERVRVDSAPGLLGGSKEFDWLVTPAIVGVQRVPSLQYSFFNPRTRRYERATTQLLTVRVVAGDVAAAPPRVAPVAAPAAMPIEPAPDAESRSLLDLLPFALGLLVAAPFPAAITWLARRPRRPRPGPTPRQRLQAVAKRNDPAAIHEIRQALVDGITARTGLDASVLTDQGAWTLALRKEGVSATSAAAVESLLFAMDAACFAESPPAQPKGAGWAAQAHEALAIVEDETLPRGAGRSSGDTNRSRVATAALMVLAAATFAGAARAQSGADDAFARGTTAYAGGDYLRAARSFADAAELMPRSSAVWANLGTASFMAADTAGAVLGWQRALRLDPLSEDIRARLARLHAPQESGAARVLPLPGFAAAGLALALWVLGWSLTARQVWRRRPARRLAVATMLVGGLAVAGAWRLVRHLEGVDLVVVMAPVPLRAIPSLGADTRSTPITGEVARVVERRGVWAHLSLDGAREGWIPLERVAALGRD